jgi:hypothetical protein
MTQGSPWIRPALRPPPGAVIAAIGSLLRSQGIIKPKQ